jgi:hypothetical protein
LTKGIVLINDIDASIGGYPTIGAAAYAGTNGRVATNGVNRIGTFLSQVSENTANGYCLLRLNVQ